jgi:hypothetical protein
MNRDRLRAVPLNKGGKMDFLEKTNFQIESIKMQIGRLADLANHGDYQLESRGWSTAEADAIERYVNRKRGAVQALRHLIRIIEFRQCAYIKRKAVDEHIMYNGDGFDFIHYNEPYGTVYLTNCYFEKYGFGDVPKGDDGRVDQNHYMFHRWKAGQGRIVGVVKKGGVTSRLFHATHFRDHAGELWSIDRITENDLKRGYHRSIAM